MTDDLMTMYHLQRSCNAKWDMRITVQWIVEERLNECIYLERQMKKSGRIKTGHHLNTSHMHYHWADTLDALKELFNYKERQMTYAVLFFMMICS